MKHGIKTPAPHVAPASNNVGDEASSQMQWILDDQGRLVVKQAPDVPPPEQFVRTRILEQDLDGANSYKQLVGQACYAVTIRNPNGEYIRVAMGGGDVTGGSAVGDYVTIAPRFSRRFLVKDRNLLWAARATGAAGSYRIETVTEEFEA
jgi:hypothetical protein